MSQQSIDRKIAASKERAASVRAEIKPGIIQGPDGRLRTDAPTPGTAEWDKWVRDRNARNPKWPSP